MTWKQIGDVARDLTDRLHVQAEHPIKFGIVTYEPGAPKNTPRWIWKCACAKCDELPPMVGLHGPFKTRRAAERDAGQVLTLHYSDTVGSG